MNTKNELGKKIKLIRKSMGWTQQYLAELSNIDDKHLSKIENGIHVPSYKTLKKLSEILHFDLQDIDNAKFENSIINQNPIYQKSLKILNTAKSDKELQNYYDALKLVSKLMNER